MRRYPPPTSKHVEPPVLDYRDHEPDQIEIKTARGKIAERIEIAITVVFLAVLASAILYVYFFAHFHS